MRETTGSGGQGCRRYYQGSAWCGRLALRLRVLNLAKRVGVGAGNEASRKGGRGKGRGNGTLREGWEGRETPGSGGQGCRRYYQGSAWCGRLALRLRVLNLAKRVGVGAGNEASRKAGRGKGRGNGTPREG